MFRTHKIEIYPNSAQEILFQKACGISRFAYNWALNQWNLQYKQGLKPSESELRKQLNSIKSIEFPWMLEMSLSQRFMQCECGNMMDRDKNASINIEVEGKKLFKLQGVKACGEVDTDVSLHKNVKSASVKHELNVGQMSYLSIF